MMPKFSTGVCVLKWMVLLAVLRLRMSPPLESLHSRKLLWKCGACGNDGNGDLWLQCGNQDCRANKPIEINLDELPDPLSVRSLNDELKKWDKPQYTPEQEGLKDWYLGDIIECDCINNPEVIMPCDDCKQVAPAEDAGRVVKRNPFKRVENFSGIPVEYSPDDETEFSTYDVHSDDSNVTLVPIKFEGDVLVVDDTRKRVMYIINGEVQDKEGTGTVRERARADCKEADELKEQTAAFTELVKYVFQVHNVFGNGDCFYRVLSYFFTGEERFYHWYRMKTMKYIRLNAAKFAVKQDNLPHFIADRSRCLVNAGNLEMFAAQECFSIKFELIDYSIQHGIQKPMVGESRGPKYTVYLARIREHFVLLKFTVKLRKIVAHAQKVIVDDLIIALMSYEKKLKEVEASKTLPSMVDTAKGFQLAKRLDAKERPPQAVQAPEVEQSGNIFVIFMRSLGII